MHGKKLPILIHHQQSMYFDDYHRNESKFGLGQLT